LLQLLVTLFAATLLNALALVPDCFSSTNWQSIGPFGGIVNTIAIDPTDGQTVYAGTGGDGRVFKSTNGGASWTAVNLGITGASVNALAIDPKDSRTVYAGTSNGGGGVFKTTNGGTSWSAVNSGITDINIEVFALAIDPSNSQTVYVGTDGGGVFKSNDGGASWSAASSGMTNTNLRALAVDPTSRLALYAGTAGGGLFKSSDGGASWTAANSGITGSYIRSLAIDPSNSQTVYAAGSVVFKSTDAGASWTAGSGLTVDAASLAIDPNHPQTVYAGTGGGGVCKSTDGGASWTAASNGIQGTYVVSLAIDPSNSQTVYAGINGYNGAVNGSRGLFKSINGSASWTATSSGVTGTTVTALALDPADSQTLYAGTFGNGLFKSVNGGASWTAANTGISLPDIAALAIDPGRSQTVYAAVSARGIFKSTDGGATWSGVNNGLTFTVPGYATIYYQDIGVIAISPGDGQTIYAGSKSTGLFKSTDGGASWGASNNGLTGLNVVSIAIDPANSQTLYAGTYGSIFKSTDAGASWTASYSGPAYTSVSCLAIDPGNSQTIYAGISGSGVLKSTDGGATWSASNSGIPNSLIYSLAIDPTNSQTLYAGTWQGLVFKSTNGGKSWTAANSGTMQANVNAIAIDQVNSTVYIGSNGVYKTLLSSNVPVINGVTNGYFSEGSSGTFRIGASGWPAPRFLVAGTLPAGISFDPATGILSGTPASGSAGSYPLLATASNGIPPDSVRGVTLTVLPGTDLNATITAPAKGYGLASVGAITGTASGTGLASIEVQVNDGSYYLQSDATFAASPAWLAASGTTSWALNTSAVSWRQGIVYNLLVRASNGSSSSAPASSSFALALQTGRTGTTLAITVPPGGLRAGQSGTISGSLQTADAGAVPGMPVTLIITPPSSSATPYPAPVATALSTDANGTFSSAAPSSFALPGVYLVQARFEGTATLAASFASQPLGVTPQSGYAIIVVGEASDHSLLAEHTATADGIYATLVNKRGFLPGDITYLKSTASSAVSKQQLQAAISQVKARYAAAPAPFYLFLIDHGSQNGFVLGDTTAASTLAPGELAPWLDDFESGVGSDVLAAFPRFVIDGSCYSGAFLSRLSKPGRVIISSAGADEQSLAGFSIYNSATGTTYTGGEYFIDTMINFLGRGDSFSSAVLQASSNVALRDPRKAAAALHSGVYDTLAQHPLLDDNADGVGSYLPVTSKDGAAAANLFLGVGTRSLGAPADITAVTATTSIPPVQAGDTPLWLQVNDNSRIAKAWIEIRTPVTSVSGSGGTGQVIPHLITQPLTFDGLRWVGGYGFPNAGSYSVLYYTQDNQTGDVSPTAHSTVYRQLANDTTVPAPFSLSSPADAAGVSSLFPLTWQSAAAKSHATYTLLVATDQNFGSIVYQEENIPQSATYLSAAKLKGLATGGYCRNGYGYCFWKVQAIDGYGAVTESGFRSFTIVSQNSPAALLTGVVRDGVTGAPVAGAIVQAGGSGFASLDNGVYLMEVPSGSVDLSASADGYQATALGSLAAPAGGVSTNDITLLPVGYQQANSITVTLPAPAAASFNTQFTVAATASSGLPVSYSSGSTSVCTNSGATFTVIASSGSCLVLYDQAGDAGYAQASQLSNSTAAVKAAAGISWNGAALSQTYDGFAKAVTATTTPAGLGYSVSYNGGATAPSAPGSYLVTATVTDANYAGSVGGTLVIAASGQTITFTPPASAGYGDQPLALSAASTSGLPVTFALVSGPAALVDNLLTITGAGSIVVQASQAGNQDFSAAAQVQKTIVVGKATLTVKADNQHRAFDSANPPFSASYSGYLNGDSYGSLAGAPALSTSATQGSPPGTYPITVTQGTLSAANYSFAFVNGTLTVTGPPKPGDCDGDGTVSIAEVQSAVDMLLGLKPVASCVDVDNSGTVTLPEVQEVINSFLGSVVSQ